jgi:phosphotriesterase-related protein
LISGLVERGFGDQILLGGDTTTAAARHAPGMAGLLRITARRLGREVGEAALASILTANPARALTWRSGAPG